MKLLNDEEGAVPDKPQASRVVARYGLEFHIKLEVSSTSAGRISLLQAKTSATSKASPMAGLPVILRISVATGKWEWNTVHALFVYDDIIGINQVRLNAAVLQLHGLGEVIKSPKVQLQIDSTLSEGGRAYVNTISR